MLNSQTQPPLQIVKLTEKLDYRKLKLEKIKKNNEALSAHQDKVEEVINKYYELQEETIVAEERQNITNLQNLISNVSQNINKLTDSQRHFTDLSGEISNLNEIIHEQFSRTTNNISNAVEIWNDAFILEQNYHLAVTETITTNNDFWLTSVAAGGISLVILAFFLSKLKDIEISPELPNTNSIRIEQLSISNRRPVVGTLTALATALFIKLTKIFK